MTVSILVLFCKIFLGIQALYLLAAGGAYWVVWHKGRATYATRRLPAGPGQAQPWNELRWSTWSIVIFAAVLTLTWQATGAGWGRGYGDIRRYGTGYLVASIPLLGLLHRGYYKCAHRAMHHRWLFRYVHKLHHGFTNPTPFAAYAFHPLEAVVEVAWCVPAAFVLPLHPLAVAIYIAVVTTVNVISHLGYEFHGPGIARCVLSSAPHSMHHSGMPTCVPRNLPVDS